MSPSNLRGKDEYYMSIALSLAMRGIGRTSPNPRVGCVIVRDGVIIGKGWHGYYGGPHAEVNAVKDAGGDIAGAAVYVTLEPCCHYGKTPPCADMLVEKKPSRVVVGIMDPNPLVDCKGAARIRDAGIEFVSGVLADKCREINKGFISRIVRARPWVTIKSAISLDGNISLSNGESKWVTSAEARNLVHSFRGENDALLTGIGTILTDDPRMDVRTSDGADPMKVILDRHLRTPSGANALKKGRTIIFCEDEAPDEKYILLRSKGAEIEKLSRESYTIDNILKRLAEIGVNYLMVEAGARVASSFIASGLADEALLFVAPKLMGRGVHFTEELAIARMNDAVLLKDVRCESVGEDFLIRGVFDCSPD
ncbi:MAG: bifunctional diaminohydroxyphosphoribosylaminopyrimidine deaminase/5-amino-6-(5-phosphoribosylamino)uracil reductase RibD [Synergistaceae bacterium]|nr:bifunctional diaminohydroxyphosphoribosylaminopyrimidine deaminase/5-amino-6-(5-phosphoribosylamino)uracil reductase RibD [Synergistaceae bacterium]